MIDEFTIDRAEFLSVCKAMKAACKSNKGPHYVDFILEPGELVIVGNWAGTVLATQGVSSGKGRISLSNLLKFIRVNHMNKKKKQDLSVTYVTSSGRFLIEDRPLNLTF